MIKKYLLLMCSLVRQYSLFQRKSKLVSFTILIIFFSLTGVQKTFAQDSFEVGFDGWVNIAGDQIDWTRITGATVSGGTGPTTGSDGASYLYIETSDPVATGDIAWLEKDFDFTNKKNANIKFDYHMFGDGIGDLNVYVNINGVLTSIFMESGDKGDAWISSSTIDLSSYDGSQIKIRFEASKGANFRGDIAIDNVSVSAENSDSDGDGVLDDVDLDDDNDGILDTDEGCAAVASTSFNLVPGESVLGDVNAGGKLVYKDAAGNTVILQAAGTAGNNNGITTGTPFDGTIVNDINSGRIVFEIGANDANDQPKLKISAFSANGTPFKIKSIGLGGVGNMDSSEAQDAIAADVEGTWSNLTSSTNTLGSAQITTSPVGATTIPGNNTTTQAELDAFNFTNMVAQGAVSEVIYNNADNAIQFDYNATFTPKNPTSSFNLIVDDINTSGIGRNILAELIATSITIESIVCRDTDGDGIPDNIDLDSDNDGCTDANEAYFGSVDRADNDEDGLYGTGTPSVDGSGRVVGASYGAPNSFYIDSNTFACFDTDGDGVPNSTDLDDDNDGILDTVECPNLNFSKDLIITNAKSGDLTVVDGGASGTPFVTDAGPSDNEAGLRYIDQASGATFYRLNTKGKDFSYIDGNNLVFRIFLVDPTEDFFGGTSDIRLGSGATQLTLDLTQDPFGQTKPTVIGDYKITVPLTAANFNVSQTEFDAVISALDYVDIRAEFWLGPTQTLESELIPLLTDPCDFDKDGIPDALDLDSDNDGIPDVIEAGGLDANNDGKADGAVGTASGTNGVPSSAGNGTSPRTTDTDGRPDYLDIDSDNDGIPDNIEGQVSLTYISPSGVATAMADDNKNGLDDKYEPLGGYATSGFVPINSDSSNDAIPDYLDTDSDNDGVLDILENGDTDITLAGIDTDDDGLDDNFDDNNDAAIEGATVNDGLGTGNKVTNAATLETAYGDEDADFNPGTGDVDYRDIRDADNDGIADLYDLDNDNDGILDTDESPGNVNPDLDADNDGIPNFKDPDFGTLNANGIVATFDSDSDGIANHEDTDSDNDGCPDALEGAGSINQSQLTTLSGGSTGGSSDNLGTTSDAEGNPIVNSTGFEQGTTAAVTDSNDKSACEIDTDGDGITDPSDIDDDNDGILDTVESNGVNPTADADNDGVPNYQDADFCTLANGICANLDVDADGIPNHLDLDSDGDGIPDNNEAQTTLGYLVALDSNSDGIPDVTANGLPTTYNFNSEELGLIPVNTDTIDNPDYLDLDSDNQGGNDTVEAGLTLVGTDTDGDGLDDAIDTTDAKIDGKADYADNNGTINSTSALPDTDNDLNSGGNVDFRDPSTPNDSDADGVVNQFDDDDDNDGILDVVEGYQFDPAICNGTDYNFTNGAYITNTPSGGNMNSVNAQFRFTTVATGLDAIVTVTAKSDGVTIVNINNTTFGNAKAFQPRIRYANNTTGDRSITFNIRFVNTGGTTSANVNSVGGFFQDVDGESFDREFYRVNNVIGYSLGNPTKIQASNLGSGVIQFIADGSGSVVNGADPINLNNTHRVFFQKQDVNNFNFTLGIAKGTNSQIDRYYSLLLDECELSTFANPSHVFLNAPNSDADTIPDYLDVDSDNDGCFDAIEAAGNFTPTNLTSSNNLADNNEGSVTAKGVPTNSGSPQATTAAVTDANIKDACLIDLSVIKTVDKPIKKVGEKVVFTIVLKNDGDANATNVQVKDLLPSGLTYDASTSVIPTNTTYNSTTGIWDLSLLTLAKGSTTTLKIGATVTTAGAIITNKTEIFSATETDKDSTPNSNN